MKQIATYVALILAAAMPVAAQQHREQSKTYPTYEQDMELLRQAGMGDLVNQAEEANNMARMVTGQTLIGDSLLSTRPLTMEGSREINGHWSTLGKGSPLTLSLTTANSSTFGTAMRFEGSILFNLRLYLTHKFNIEGRANCGHSPHTVEDVALDAIEPLATIDGRISRVKAYYRVRYGNPQRVGQFNCSGKVAALSTEFVQSLSGSWYAPEWSLYLRDIPPQQKPQ